MDFLTSHTSVPLWVWAVLVFFVDIGLKSMHQHVVYIPRLFLMPVIMTILKYQDFLSTNVAAMYAVIFLSFGSMIGLFFARQAVVSFDKKAWTVQLPGSYVTFLFWMLFFSLKLLFEYLEKLTQALLKDVF